MPPAAARTLILQYIAEKGARLDKKDKQGRTPLDIASGAGGGGGGRGGRGAAVPAAVDEAAAAQLPVTRPQPISCGN